MTRMRRAPAPTDPALVDQNPTVRRYSLAFSQRQDGSLDMLIGKMDGTSKRYSFALVRTPPFGWPLDAPVDELVLIASHCLADDPELRHW